MRYLDVCSGISAFTLGNEGLGFTCAGYSEIDNFPRAVLEQRYGAVPVEDDHRWSEGQNFTPLFGDFTKIEAHHVGPVDLLIGGTPCQSFSVAGKRLGLDDPRGNLTLEFLALARRLRVPWLAWENVPGVLSDDKARTMGTFLGLLGELGYGWAYRVLDAQYIRVDGAERAVPQRRKRVFVVGHLGDATGPAAVLFERESLRGDSAPSRKAGQGAAPTLSARTKDGGGLGTDFECGGGLIAETAATLTCGGRSAGRRQEDDINLVAHALRGEGFDASEDGTGRGTPLVVVAGGPVQAVAFAQNTRDEVQLFGSDGQTVGALAAEPGMKQQSFITQPYVITERSRDGGSCLDYRADGTANTILTPSGGRGGMGVGAISYGWQVRRLTPVECEALMGVPRGFTNITYRGKPAADGPRYKALGNSQCTNVMRWIAHGIARTDSALRIGTPAAD